MLAAAVNLLLFGLVKQIVLFGKGKKVFCDNPVMLRMLHRYIGVKGSPDNDVLSAEMAKQSQIRSLATEFCAVGLGACRMGANVLNKITRESRDVSKGSKKWKYACSWWRGMEQMRMRGMTKDIHDAHDRLRSEDENATSALFENSEARFAKLLGVTSFHRVVGLNILEYEDEILILDFSASEHMHKVSKFVEGMYQYAENYRLCGDPKVDRLGFRDALGKGVDWLVKALKETGFSDAIARSMKQSVALLQNEFHSEAEKLKTGYEDKTRAMRESIPEIVKLRTYWHDRISTLPINDRAKLDIANLYYCLPAPDCTLPLLFRKASEVMQNSREIDSSFWRKFMNYVKAVDFCKAILRERNFPKDKTADNYSFHDEPWAKSCLQGKLKTPPDKDMGKVWIYRYYEYKDQLPTWYYTAADVTRVEPDIFHDMVAFSDKDRALGNELMYVLEHAPMITPKYHPDDIYKALTNGTDRWDRVAEMAAKSENTKPGVKVRETWSADAITRELTTCYDQVAIPLSMLYAGVTATRGAGHVAKIFDEICKFTRADKKGVAIIVSNDVSGWSPQADRTAWGEHHDYVVQTTKAPECLNMNSMWTKITAVLSKRGYHKKVAVPRALFQGWTRTLDTLLNARLSLYCVREGRSNGTLTKEEAAIIAGLIDDAVQAVIMNEKRGKETLQNTSSRPKNHSYRWGSSSGKNPDEQS